LEGGIDEAGSIHHIPTKDTASLAEVFRRRVIKLFVDMGLLDRRFALKILSCKHSVFSVDASLSIPASSKKAPVNLNQYIINHPGNPADYLQKILYLCSNRYGLYSSRTRRKATRDGSLAKYGYTSTPQDTTGQHSNLEMQNVSNKASWRSWARLIQKVY
jgi:hypothetical protein